MVFSSYATFAQTASTVPSVSASTGANVSTTPNTTTKAVPAAAATAGLAVNTSTLAFGNVALSSAALETVTLTSTGTTAVTINSASVTGVGFALSGQGLPVTLNPNKTLVLNVKFTPPAAMAESGTLTIRSTSSTSPVITVSLSGIGTAATGAKLTVSTANLAFGGVPLTQSETEPVTLTSSGTSPVTVQSVALSGSNFTLSGATFPVTLNPGIAVTLNILFKPTSANTQTGALTIHSNSSTATTSVVALSGVGDHEVTLNWTPPSSTPVPVAGYNVYRATGTSTAYARINTSTIVQPTYVDTTVVAGSTYSYVVKSMASAGLESAASNNTNVVIP
ncbi:choice-of-anchor D domain-containing protein [Silvibacterium acidisoli]|uniref:choice-of-anchor D domain-containing protein n=1 Tax=Acidobacteriaceae bacterium ZG23-2 TaxID=2883246 RepID=UPI00406BE1E8